MTRGDVPAPVAGIAPTGLPVGAGSVSPAVPHGKARTAGETVNTEETDTQPPPAATGRAAWKAAIAAHNATQARGRVRAKVKQPGPGMTRRTPPGGAA